MIAGKWVGPALFAGVSAIAAGPPESLPPSVADRPTSLEYCYEDQFALAAGPYLRAAPARAATPTRIDAGDPCIRGDLARCARVPLDPARPWIAGARAGDWICLTNGTDAGWVPLKDLALEPAPTRSASDWLGDWERDRGSGTLAIRAAKDGKSVEVTGDAEWRAGPNADPHVGQLSGESTPAGVVLMLGDPRCVAPDRAEKATAVESCLDCNARLVLVNETLLVTDNRNCGGMNVNFDGVYHRRRK
jgi:hypothetical protein